VRKPIVLAGIALLALVALVGGWYYASPGFTVKAMVEAAQDGDEARFSSYVDYDALRSDMKSELTTRLQEEAKRDGSAEAKLGLAMGMAMMNPIVDSMVSPKGMQTAFANLAKQQQAAKSGAAGAKSEAGKAASGEGGGANPAVPADPEIQRQGLNRFIVTAKDTPGSGLVFERRGLSWKLAGIDLPAAAPAAR
jgi:hypothetical protein